MSIVIPAATSAWERARESLVIPALAYVEKNFTAKYFNWQRVGEPGDEKITVTHTLNGIEAQTRPGFTIIADKPRMESAQFIVPWTGKEYEYSIEAARKLSKAGVNPAVPLARELGIGVDKVMWQGVDSVTDDTPTNLAQGVTVYGITDAGDDALQRPTILDGGTTSGKWDKAGNSMKDINKIKSMLMKSGFNGPYGLFYPIGAEEAFSHPIATSDTSFGNTSNKEYAEKVFNVVAPLPKDLAGNCIASGGTEDDTDFQMWGVAMGSAKAMFTQEFGIEALPWDRKTETGTIRGGARVFPTFEVINIGGTQYKGVVEIDAVDLHT